MIKNKNLRNLAYGSIIIPFLMTASIAFAETQSSTDLQTLVNQLQEQIKTLQAKVDALRQAQSQVVQAAKDIGGTLKLIRQLREGMSGDDVKTLQTILAFDPSIYPEGIISGYYGRLTAKAIRKFQEKHGFEQIGNVGPKTFKRLNELVEKNQKSFMKFDNTIDKIEGILASTTPGQTVTICHIPPGNPSSKHTITIGSPALKAHLNHGDTTGPCAGTPPPPEQDTTAPVISNSSVSGITSTVATVTWVTNENADSKVEYGTTTAYGPVLSNSTRVTNHTVSLSSLSPSTTYHFRVSSSDAAGNSATSSDSTFITLATPDTTAPAISNIAVSALTSVSATVSWATDETADSKINFGTTTGYGSSLSDSSFITSHSLNLTGLSSSTLYHFQVVSKDASGNTATSSDQTFTTQAPPDTTSPVISGMSASNVSSTTATVSWTTNEAATSKVYYSTTTSFDLGSALNVSDTALLTSHSSALTGLTASTTYYYAVESKDGANNTATSSEQSFLTLP